MYKNQQNQPIKVAIFEITSLFSAKRAAENHNIIPIAASAGWERYSPWYGPAASRQIKLAGCAAEKLS